MALTTGDDYYDLLRGSYRAKRDFLVSELSRIGFSVRLPPATYYVCADFRPLGFADDVEFCRYLIDEIGVAAIPPSVFYASSGEGKTYVRFAFCKKDETLETAVSRLKRLCE